MSWPKFLRGLGDAHAAARWAVMERERLGLVEREAEEEVLEPWAPPGGNLQTLVLGDFKSSVVSPPSTTERSPAAGAPTPPVPNPAAGDQPNSNEEKR